MNAPLLPGFEQLALREEAAGTLVMGNSITGRADDLTSSATISGFKPDVAKGVNSTDTLAPALMAPRPPTPPAPARLEMSPAYFRARQFLAMLSPRERAAVAARPRFWSMAYLRRSDDADLDELP